MAKDKKLVALDDLKSVAQDWTPPSTPPADVPVEVAPEVVAPTSPVAMNPRFLNDFVVDHNPGAVTKIAWMSEEGIRRVEVPGWLFEKFRK